MMRRFTIAIPAFKIQFFEKALVSALLQNFEDYEVLVVNDKSPDDIGGVVERYACDRLRYVENVANLGAESVVKNWNRCLELSRGEYVLLLGDDDCLKSNCLKVYSDMIDKYPNDVVFHCRTEIINEVDEVIDFTEGYAEFEPWYEHLLYRLKGYRKQFISDFIFKKEALKEIGGFCDLPLAWGSDDITVVELAKGRRLVNLNEVLFSYRKSDISISASGNLLKKAEAVNEYLKWVECSIRSLEDDNYIRLLERELTRYGKRQFRDLAAKLFRSFSFIEVMKLRRYGLGMKDLFVSILNCVKGGGS